jgi:hypothetical protein
MQITIPTLSAKQLILILCTVLLALRLAGPPAVTAQRAAAPPMAQVGPGAPLPVYVVNEEAPLLPEGFVPGSSWKFTTWTIPSTLSFTATVDKVSGGWAYLKLPSEAAGKSKWYFIPEMPGVWEPQ